MKSSIITVAAFLFLSFAAHACEGFSAPNSFSSARSANVGVASSVSSTQLGLFGGLFGNKKEEENTDPSIPKRVFEIPCTQIKLGGLRFCLGLYLIGQQGTPVKGSWKANQASEGVLDMYYMDNTAMFSVVLTENSVSIDRYGLTPSIQYQLQESLLLHTLLDEIQALALEGEEVDEENRLLVFSNPEEAVSDARKYLAARPLEAGDV